MTAKTDEGGDPIASADRESAPPGALPSIIVDPSISSPAPAAPRDETAQGAHAANGSAGAVPQQAPSAPPAPDATNGSASDRLSIEDADRFAASIRPSWEPPAPSAVVAAPPQRAAPDLGARGEDLARVPQSRKSGILLTLGAVSSFIGLGALALLSSRHTPPPSWETTPAQQPETPSAPLPEAVAPAPPPAAPVAPAPPAIEPSALAEAAPLAPADPAAVPVASADPTAQAPGITPVIAAPAIAAPAIAAPAIVAPATEAASAPASLPQVTPAARVEPAAQPAQPEPVPVAAPKLVKVRISATPSDAELSLDGQSIPNPFEAEVMISGKHRVQAKANGHRSADVTVPFDQPQELALRLERLEPAAKPRARRTRSAPTPRKTTPVNRGAGFVSESPY